MKEVIIKGVSCISPQDPDLAKWWTVSLPRINSNRFVAFVPDYGKYINPAMARRMGRVIKMGIAAASMALEDAHLQKAEAVIVGTALGSLGDTEKFLLSVIENNEQYLTPTHFIQSLQNTVAAQIALKIDCKGHNFTFVHKGFSFESAMLDAMLLLQEGETRNILVGGLDEMTNHNFLIYDKLGFWKQDPINPIQLIESGSRGTIGGEGANFFILDSKQAPEDYARISWLHIFTTNGRSPSDIYEKIRAVLIKHSVDLQGVSLALLGRNGCIENDLIYKVIQQELLKYTKIGYFKHLCGEYQTSTAFAVWLATVGIKLGRMPIDVIGDFPEKRLDRVLICNNYDNNFSLMLIDRIN